MKGHAIALVLALCLAISWIQTRRPALTTAQEPPSVHYLLTPYIGGSPCNEFLESFDNPDAGWFTGHQSGLLTEITGGEYRMQVSGGGTIWMIPAPVCAHVDYRAAVEARWAGPTGNFYGLLFGLDDVANRVYLFVINSDARVWLVFEVVNGSLNTVIDATASEVILPGGGVNRLSAERSGGTISLAINGAPVGELPAGAPGAPVIAGLVAASYISQPAVDARFDNFAYFYNGSLE